MNLPNPAQLAKNSPQPPPSIETLDRRREAVARERLLYTVLHEWRRSGRYNYTDAELHAEIDRRIERLKFITAQKKQTLIPLEPEAAETSRQTKYDALVATKETQKARIAHVRLLLRAAKGHGHNRSELARLIGCRESDLCQACLKLVLSEEAVQPFKRRGPSGRDQAVLVLTEFASEVTR